MSTPSRPQSPGFPPSTQQRPIRMMPQRAPLLSGQTWTRQQSQGPLITPPPPPQPALQDGRMPSPPQLGWGKGRDVGSSRVDLMEKPSDLQNEAKALAEDDYATPTPAGAPGAQEELTLEVFMAMVAHQQMLDTAANEARSGLDTYELSENGETNAMEVEGTQHHQTDLVGDAPLHDGTADKPARKRQRVESEMGPYEGPEKRNAAVTIPAPAHQQTPLTALPQPPAYPTTTAEENRLSPLERSGAHDVPPPYGTPLPPPPFCPSPEGTCAALEGVRGLMLEGVPRGPTYEEKGKAREAGYAASNPDQETRQPSGMVQIPVEELARLRERARLHAEAEDSDAGNSTPRADNARHERGAGGPQYCAVHGQIPARPPRATRPPTPPLPLRRLGQDNSLPASPEFPIKVNWGNPEEVKRFNALVRYAIERSAWATASTNDQQAAMDVDSPQEQDRSGEADAARSAGTLTTRTSLEIERAAQIASLGLSKPLRDRFPVVNVRSPSDRLRGIPPAAKEAFRSQPRGTTAVLEVYGGKNYDHESAARVTPDIERVIKTATGLESFGLAPPPRATANTDPTEVPTAWLLTGLTPRATELLANQHAFATASVAFFVYDKPEAIPTYLFALKGFNQSDTATAIKIVQEEFRREPMYGMLQSRVEANPVLNKDPDAADKLIDEIKVVLRRSVGENASKALLGHVYMGSPTLAPDQWTAWIDDIKEKGFSDAFYNFELADVKLRCDRCHAADHTTDQCEYTHLGDWQGTYIEPPTTPLAPPAQTDIGTNENGTTAGAMAYAGGRGGGRGAFRGYQQGARRGYGSRDRGGRGYAGAGRARGG
ncbi:hypothetical protein OH77DRAFT_1418308 [Trametes cingulata]|nr:hypothetical protein OH77DRAFT_1418308 [Trametes cingulata]